jgi:hypothetical protein
VAVERMLCASHTQAVMADRRSAMLYTIVVVLLVLWLLGLVTSFTAGGLLHVLLVVAAIILVFQLVSGRRG